MNRLKQTLGKIKQWFLYSVMCRFFHKIDVLENCSFVDTVSGKTVGRFKCQKCDKEYLANNKRDMFRCYV